MERDAEIRVAVGNRLAGSKQRCSARRCEQSPIEYKRLSIKIEAYRIDIAGEA